MFLPWRKSLPYVAIQDYHSTGETDNKCGLDQASLEDVHIDDSPKVQEHMSPSRSRILLKLGLLAGVLVVTITLVTLSVINSSRSPSTFGSDKRKVQVHVSSALRSTLKRIRVGTPQPKPAFWVAVSTSSCGHGFLLAALLTPTICSYTQKIVHGSTTKTLVRQKLRREMFGKKFLTERDEYLERGENTARIASKCCSVWHRYSGTKNHTLKVWCNMIMQNTARRCY